MTTVQAQPYYDYGGMDNRHDSYRTTTEYPSEYTDRNSYDNSYEPKVKGYGNDNSDRKSYGKDSYYKSQYQSYKPDYNEPQYPSYGKDKGDRDKSKDSSKSVDIKKINCINTNININGNNTGDINLGNKGQGAVKGYSGAYSSGSGGYASDEGYYDGNYKKDKGITCIINNNNNNTNIVADGGGNVTDGNGNVTRDCQFCFSEITTQLNTFLNNTRTVIGGVDVNSTAQLCAALTAAAQPGGIPTVTVAQLVSILSAAITDPAEAQIILRVVLCLLELDPPLLAGSITPTAGFEVPSIGTLEEEQSIGPAGSLAPFDVLSGGTEDSSALEKIAKLKQQWLDLLP